MLGQAGPHFGTIQPAEFFVGLLNLDTQYWRYRAYQIVPIVAVYPGTDLIAIVDIWTRGPAAARRCPIEDIAYYILI